MSAAVVQRPVQAYQELNLVWEQIYSSEELDRVIFYVTNARRYEKFGGWTILQLELFSSRSSRRPVRSQVRLGSGVVRGMLLALAAPEGETNVLMLQRRKKRNREGIEFEEYAFLKASLLSTLSKDIRYARRDLSLSLKYTRLLSIETRKKFLINELWSSFEIIGAKEEKGNDQLRLLWFWRSWVATHKNFGYLVQVAEAHQNVGYQATL